MAKTLVADGNVRIVLKGNRLMVVVYSKYEGQTRTYYMKQDKTFNKDTKWDDEYNNCTSFVDALLHHIKNEGVNITSTKKYAVV